MIYAPPSPSNKDKKKTKQKKVRKRLFFHKQNAVHVHRTFSPLDGVNT